MLCLEIDSELHSFTYSINVASNVDVEMICILLRPTILPRPFSCIIIAVLYAPPWYNVDMQRSLKAYILSCIDFFRAKYSHPGFIICGDFNTFDTNFFSKLLHFVQLVKKPTRGERILDKFFTDCSAYYNEAEILPPLGRSDHNCFLVLPNCGSQPQIGHRFYYKRIISSSAHEAIACSLLNFNWSQLYQEPLVQDQANIFYDVVLNCINTFAPLVLCKKKNNDRPWVTDYFKGVVRDRDQAFKRDDKLLYRKLRNKVNRLRKSLCRSYIDNKII